MCKWTIDGWDRVRNLYQMMCETTVDGWERWTTHTRWCTKQLLMDESEKIIHARWCTKQLLTDEAYEWIPMPDEVRNSCWWMRAMKEYPHLMMYKTIVNVWDNKESTPDDVWHHFLMDEIVEGLLIPGDVQKTVDARDRWRNPCKMMYETTVDGWDQWRTTHTGWYTEQLFMDETDDGIRIRRCTN